MQVKSIADFSKGDILQLFRPSLNYSLSVIYLLCLLMSGRLRHVLLIYSIRHSVVSMSNLPWSCRSGIAESADTMVRISIIHVTFDLLLKVRDVTSLKFILL